MVENLAPSPNTPATDAAADLLARIAVDPACGERYPHGTILIPVDSPSASARIARAISEDRPFALVFPDGSDVLSHPEPAGWLSEFHLTGELAKWILTGSEPKLDIAAADEVKHAGLL
jgi:hypothetical protein